LTDAELIDKLLLSILSFAGKIEFAQIRSFIAHALFDSSSMMATIRNEFKNDMPYASPTRRVLLSVFLLFHLFVIVVWAFPVDQRQLRKIKRFIAPYMVWSGLTQGWSLFAPDPQSINAYLVAQITYRDGQNKIWKFPMPQDFGYYRRYFMSRQLKWSSDILRIDTNAVLWPDAARYVARVNNAPNNPPVTVALVRHWSFIAPPKSGQSETWSQYTFFTYSVLPGDLL
jgi:hypothetical protein